MSGEDTRETLFPERKRRYQATQLMNLLLRAPMAPVIRLLHALGVSGDAASWMSLVAYTTGAGFFVAGGESGRRLGLLAFCVGMFLEFVDGGLARLRGPSPIGHFLSKIVEHAYVVLLAPSLAVGLYRDGECGLAVLLLGIVGPSAHLLFRAALDAIGHAHPEQELARWADGELSELQCYAVAQLLPDHARFRTRHRLPRVLRENLMESTGIQPLLLLGTLLSGHAAWFVAYYGIVQLGCWSAFTALKLLMLKRGGGKLL